MALFRFTLSIFEVMKPLAETRLPTKFGGFRILAFEDRVCEMPTMTLISDRFVENTDSPVPVRIHSECMTGDVFSSSRCDCGAQLDASMQSLQQEGGILLYLRQEGRGIGLVNKIRAYALQDQGHDTVEANELLGFAPDLREYNICLDILQHFKISSVNLLTNNPKKVSALEEVGISVTKRTSLHEGENEKNKNYLDTKRDKMGHLR